MPREEVASPAKTPGIPVGYTLERLLYNPASETVVAEMKGPPEPPLPGLNRLFMRSRHAEGYERIGDPPADVSYRTAVTCEKYPIVIFNTIKWNRASGGGNWDGVYAFNLLTKKLTFCLAEDKLVVPVPRLRAFISTLISLSDDGEALYVNVGIETAVLAVRGRESGISSSDSSSHNARVEEISGFFLHLAPTALIGYLGQYFAFPRS